MTDTTQQRRRAGLAFGLEPGDDLPGVHPGLDKLYGHGSLDRLGLLGHPDRPHPPFTDLFDQLEFAVNPGSRQIARLASRRLWQIKSSVGIGMKRCRHASFEIKIAHMIYGWNFT